MESLALIDGALGDSRASGPVRADPNALLLGAVWATPPPTPRVSAGAAPNGTIGNASSASAAATAPPLPGATGAAGGAAAADSGSGGLSALLPPPPGAPVVVLFPDTLDLRIFVLPPPRERLLSASLTFLTILGSWAWKLGMVASSGVSAGLIAGLVFGIGVRLRPMGVSASMAMCVLGAALLGGGWDSFCLCLALWLSTMWKHGEWLYSHPERAPLLFFLVRSTADVAFGFLVASTMQFYRAKGAGIPVGPLPPSTSALPPPSTGAGAEGQYPFRVNGEQWTAVTPPGLAGSRSRARR